MSKCYRIRVTQSGIVTHKQRDLYQVWVVCFYSYCKDTVSFCRSVVLQSCTHGSGRPWPRPRKSSASTMDLHMPTETLMLDTPSIKWALFLSGSQAPLEITLHHKTHVEQHIYNTRQKNPICGHTVTSICLLPLSSHRVGGQLHPGQVANL